MHSSVRFVAGLAIVILLCSCSSRDASWKDTFPVSGEVYVDGQPAATLKIVFQDVKGIDTENTTFSSAFTKEDGTFSVSTYEEGDGIPEGEYILTFMWGQMNPLSMQYGGPDKLKGKYLDPKKSEFRVTVEEGKPAEMGRLDLTTN